jgi:hypothetical protein
MPSGKTSMLLYRIEQKLVFGITVARGFSWQMRFVGQSKYLKQEKVSAIFYLHMGL